MISIHEANSRWWGSPVGTLTQPDFFHLPMDEQERMLSPFAWVEYKADLSSAPSAASIRHAGFSWVDVQIPFRVSLTDIQLSDSLLAYECSSATDDPFTLCTEDMRHFADERFSQLPGMHDRRLGMRYAAWANDLIARDPASCLRLTLNGNLQGWFLSERSGSTVNLTLAMLASSARISGQHLYQRCLFEFGNQGGRVGKAAFSVRNTKVMNIYSSLGALFTTPSAIWMWVSKEIDR